MRIYSILMFLFLFNSPTHAHTTRNDNFVYAAVAHLEPLVEIELRLYEITLPFLHMHRDNTSSPLHHFVLQLEDAMRLTDEDLEKYIGNPINSFVMIKRFVQVWYFIPTRHDVDVLISKDVSDLLQANDMYLPSTLVDLPGAAAGILRLQKTYGFTANSIADGYVAEGVDVGHQLTAEDCMMIADSALTHTMYVLMKEWVLQAQHMLNTYPTYRHGNTTLIAVNEFLSYIGYLSGDMKLALFHTQLVLNEDPQHQGALENKRVYKWYVDNNEQCNDTASHYYEWGVQQLNVYRNETFATSCRQVRSSGGLRVKGFKDPWIAERSFYRADIPWLYLKPLKVTQYHDNPEIYLYHDVITEQYMDEIKYLADPRLTYAQVVDSLTGEVTFRDYRVAKRVFFDREAYPDEKDILEKLERPFEVISSLNPGTVEEIQVNNYGLGGLYDFHHDYGYKGSVISNYLNSGNRIATILMYLSDVEAGGETVFTEIGVSIPPLKGSAVLWYNLHRNGTGFYNTRHASCPVISGSKWVANKWIHEAGNEFTRPCTLQQYE